MYRIYPLQPGCVHQARVCRPLGPGRLSCRSSHVHKCLATEPTIACAGSIILLSTCRAKRRYIGTRHWRQEWKAQRPHPRGGSLCQRHFLWTMNRCTACGEPGSYYYTYEGDTYPQRKSVLHDEIHFFVFLSFDVVCRQRGTITDAFIEHSLAGKGVIPFLLLLSGWRLRKICFLGQRLRALH